MGLVADSALEQGGTVVGIIPEHIQSREVEHRDLTELHIVQTMHQRKQMMVDRSGRFCDFAGRYGHLDEFFELVTWKQLGLHDKPIVVVNLNGYWTQLIEAIHNVAPEILCVMRIWACLKWWKRLKKCRKPLKTRANEKFDPATKWI